MHMNRAHLISKLATTFHLNVEERIEFNDIPITLDELSKAISESITDSGTFPPTWSLEQDFDGVLVYSKGNKIIATYKSEVSLGQYKTIKEKSFSNIKAATKFVAQNMFSEGIDGVPVKW